MFHFYSEFSFLLYSLSCTCISLYVHVHVHNVIKLHDIVYTREMHTVYMYMYILTQYVCIMCVCILTLYVHVRIMCVCRFKYYERWASAHEFPFQNIVNDGSTMLDNRLCVKLCFTATTALNHH